MSKVINLPQSQPCHEEASLWVTRLDEGLTEQQEAALRTWLAADPQHVEAFLELARLWDKMGSLSRLSALFPPPRRRTRPARVVWAAAASVALVVFAGLWGLRFMSTDLAPGAESPSSMASWHNVYETAVGEHSTITLPDGSQLMLNTNSRIVINYGDAHRLLKLERGEVHVRVAKDPERPLSVFAADRIVQAVGTEFNIQITDQQRIELVVTEGKVRVGIRDAQTAGKESEQPAVLLPDALTVAASEGIILGAADETVTELSADDIEVQLSWQNGNLIFRGESLEEAMKEVSRYTSVEFVFLDEDLKKVRVAGLFKSDDVDGLLAVLHENFQIDFKRIDDRKVLLDSQAVTP